ncbi:enoyl-CoA hydratase [Sulfurifustis variabilis]|uniref:Enoyl-CoA hydratase n=1 Tax=Sulfurifustis variabilis TaxID=1675686 RepID=A0A1B4V4Q8_9GAMM|nr:crotonase/enoyl-CoA hydratase family protein [Sulfurifustis variabilis]BAU48528.1 enoyl-CoA hydratase [Sulfurifustis variabilis]
MELAAQATLPFTDYAHLLTQYDPERRSLWYYLAPKPRPAFTPGLLADILDFQHRVADSLKSPLHNPHSVDYLVLASATPRVFNLGGDLDLFGRLILSNDRAGLMNYANACVEAVYRNASNLGCPSLTTITLVQGTALGGGFEAAISSNVVIAERGAQFGFPEILFNLFPGMGAVSLLSRRIGMVRAERFLKSGKQHTAEELYEAGVIDVLANEGEGIHAVNNFIRQHRRSRNGLLAIRDAKARVQPLTREELSSVVEIWVDAALRLTAHDLKVMRRLVAAQLRLDAGSERTAAAEDMGGESVIAFPAHTAAGLAY